jgi:glycerol transport system ATP-binding protein
MGLLLKDINKYVDGKMHLQDINLELQAGQRYVLLGRTLAGKTSLLRMMAGLDRPTSGQVMVDGVDVTGMSVRKRSVAMVYQQFINYPSLTVYDNIASPLKVAGRSKEEIDRRVRRLAGVLHIEGLLDRLPAELSGGQQQRTAIARALVKESHLLLLDEPLVNLDYKLREELRDELLQLFGKRESIVVYTTTEPIEALMLGGNVIVMHEGRILQMGPTAHVYSHPASTTVAENFSDPPINFAIAEVKGGNAHLRIGIDFTLKGRHAELPDGEYTFGVRANHLHIKPHSDEVIAIPSKVELAEINGSETFVHFSYRDRSMVLQETGVHQYQFGDEFTAYVHPTDFYVFDADGNLAVPPEESGTSPDQVALGGS